MRVLIVDDSPVLRVLLRAVLESTGFEVRIDELLRTLRNMAQVKIVRRYKPSAAGATATPPEAPSRVAQTIADAPRLVAIGASAGGPAALKTLLQNLQPAQPWALILVQHIAAGFLPSFCHWLARSEKHTSEL